MVPNAHFRNDVQGIFAWSFRPSKAARYTGAELKNKAAGAWRRSTSRDRGRGYDDEIVERSWLSKGATLCCVHRSSLYDHGDRPRRVAGVGHRHGPGVAGAQPPCSNYPNVNLTTVQRCRLGPGPESLASRE
jgi:hypothetical protein